MTTAENARIAFELASRLGPGRFGWHKNDSVGEIFRIQDAKTANERIGACWMKGRLLKGDLVLCTNHTGDGFHDYVVLEKGGNYIKAVTGSSFGAYGIAGGTKVATLEKEDFVELLSSPSNTLVSGSMFRSVEEATRGVHLQKLVASF